MTECCKDLFLTLEKYELDEPQFTKEDVLTVVSYILSWHQRQCRCVFKDQLNLSRLEDQLEILIQTAIDCISSWSTSSKDDDTDWTLAEKERLFLSLAKIFQIHFPFYQARQIPLVRQDITAKDCSKYCDMSVGEVSEALLINIAYFCERGGLNEISNAFRQTGHKALPFTIAHLLISAISQIRVWFSVQAIIQYIVPLRGPVIRYLCQLSDKELKQQDGWAMADSMWNGVKGPTDAMPIFDSFTLDSMDLAFKYFTSSTLTVRLAGLSQIANQVHVFMDIFQTNSVSEADRGELSQWLVDNNIIEHLFGPNLHVELLKQSQIILNYLAQETRITTQHLDCIWAAAQLKHASRYVHDLLTVLTKHLDMSSILYLLDLVSKPHPSMHTKQTLFLASLLLRIIWSSGLTPETPGACSAHVNSPVHGSYNTTGATSADVAAAMQRKFRQSGGSMSQSSSRSNSVSEISIDGDHRDSESPTPRKFTDLPSQDLGITEPHSEPSLPEDYSTPHHGYGHLHKTDDADIDSTSCTNSHASSLSDRRDLEDFDGEDIEDDLNQLEAVAALRNVQSNQGDCDDKGFDLNVVCEEGKTLLWDLLQDHNAIHLEDGLVREAEKLLCQLICYTGEKKIRMKFIEGCVDNLANERSVVMSLQLLPKLFSSLQQYVNNSYGPHWVTNWTVSELDVMGLFFKNLVLYMNNVAEAGTPPPCALYSHREEVKARLQFLSSIYSSELSKPDFGLSLDQVDILWSALVNDEQCSDEALEWFVQQAQSKDLHALSLEALQYIFTEKLPSLAPDTFTMTGLTLLQQLFKMFDNSSNVKCNNPDAVYGIDQLWEIAVQAQSTEVSMDAISYLNSLYINANGGSLKLEDEFITRCMTSIKDAAKDISSESKATKLQIIERGITLLKSHIESFKKRFSFHLRLWLLDGQGMTCHRQKTQHTSEKHYPIRVMCQPAGLSDKGTFKMHLSDLVSELRAEVTHWCQKLQERIKNESQGEGTSKHSPLSPFPPQLHPPFRLISQGHELTPDLDEKTLADVGFKDLQLVFVSVGAVKRESYHSDNQIPSSALPCPKWDNAPMVILLQDKHFDELFSILEILDRQTNLIETEDQTMEVDKEIKRIDCGDDMQNKQIETEKHSDQMVGEELEKNIEQDEAAAGEREEGTQNKQTIEQQDDNMKESGSITVEKIHGRNNGRHKKAAKESQSQYLCQLMWELLCLLPTNPSVLSRLKYFERFLTSGSESKTGDAEEQEHSYQEFLVPWNHLLDPGYPHKLLYCLQVVDLIHFSYSNKQLYSSHSSKSSSDSSDTSDEEADKSQPLASWGSRFVEFGGLQHLYNTLMNGHLEVARCYDLWTPWQEECLAYLLKLICEFGTIKSDEDEDEVFSGSDGEQQLPQFQHKDGRFRIRYKSTDKEETIFIKCLSQQLMSMVELEPLLDKLLAVSQKSTLQIHTGHHKGVRGGEVVHNSVSLLVSWAYTDSRVVGALLKHKNFKPWLKHLVLLAREPVVRCEACRGLYRLSLIKDSPCLMQLMDALLEFLPLAQSLQTKASGSAGRGRHSDSCTQEYFSILCRLVDGLPIQDGTKDHEIDLNSFAIMLSDYIIKSASSKSHSRHEEEGLCGMLKLCTAVMRHDPPFKYSERGLEFLRDVFSACLFDLPRDCYDDKTLPLCKHKSSRSAAYDLLLEMAKESKENFLELQSLLMRHHRPGSSRLQGGRKHSSYGWHYWPHDNEKSPCGLVGIINLGATCYMASCLQQLFMMPEAKASILNAKMTGDSRNDQFLKELQKMFCFLMMSERKAYNPRSFCRTYTMDKQLINTGEQKDMTEFFTDLISKLEDMSPSLRDLVRELFCGVITNNVVSLDCTHVSKTKEEFYSVRCTVADMKNLYESLDEVTIKDTLDGDNMYTCSQCCKKVRAEKRACFTVLPKILCFNTMRYTFNMVTMMKEKVNTHFSFPLQLNMAPYSEEYLMGDKADQDPEKDDNYWYNLIGVVVHTGTAEGGHYYSFIRNRSDPLQDQWFLFNDAEVKPFDPSQIASECFGGEMTTKTYDVVSEKFMDLSFEKTHSAYMLFYERNTPNTEPQEVPLITLSPDLADWICQDNIQFLHDKHIFDTTYFNFLWLLCSSIPPTLPENEIVLLSNVKLSTSFLLETLVHSKEKMYLKNWSELLVNHLESSSSTCEWFLNSLAVDDWWLQQMFVKCPVQNIRHMFARLCVQAIQAFRVYYLQTDENDVDGVQLDRGPFSYVMRFIKAVLKLLDLHNIRSYIKNLSELFGFLHQFALIGQEEREFLLAIEAISTMIHFYLRTKTPETLIESSADDDDDDMDDDDDDVVPLLPEDKYRGSSLEKMVSLITVLVESSWRERQLNLSKNDIDALVGGKEIKGLTFLFQVIKDNVNLRHTANLIMSLCRYNNKLAENIVSMLIASVQKLPSEQSQSFFKLLSMLTELQGGPPGIPSFTNLTLARIWEAAEYNAMLCLDWLTLIAPKNKMAHKWVLDNMDKWVEKYLIADTNPRIRNASACLLVSLVPNNHFRLGFRTRSFTTPHKDLQLSDEAIAILHKIYTTLLELLSTARNYCDRTIQSTTKLVSFFAVLNYCLVSKTEKEMFTPYSADLWRLFHPPMSEPNISVHHNKQALLLFWYHACQDCEANLAFITDTPQVSSNIALNYILSSDEPDVINFNRNVLPAYYGLLRLCCEHSRTFTRQLANHSNMRWAFEHLTSRLNHYPQAIEELFALMRLFAGHGHPDLTAEEKTASANFRKNTVVMYLNCLDGVSHWTTLVTAFKILLHTEEDRLIVLVNQGLLTLSDAITTLHMMYHEATACHVTGDLREVLGVLKEVLMCSQNHMDKPEVCSSILGWSDKMEIAQKLLSLLNSYTPKDLHSSCIDVLRAILVLYPSDCGEVLIPYILASHCKWHGSQHQPIPGPYFPRKHTKVIVSSKSLPRPSVPELNMFLHPSYVETPKSVDETYDKAMTSYFQPYHFFVDKLVRVGLNQDRVSESCISLSCLLAIEAIPLHFPFFAKLWSEVYQKSGEHSKYKDCIKQLCQRQEFIEYIDSVLLEERECLNVQEIYSFFCCMFPRVHTVVLNNQWKTLVHTLVTAVIADQPAAATASEEELLQIARRITADLRAMSLLFTVCSPKKSDVSSLLLPSLEELLSICKKHQTKKQKRLKTRQTSSEPDTTPDDSTSQGGSSEQDEGPKKKRRKTNDSDDDGNKSDTRTASPSPSTSGETSKTKCDEDEGGEDTPAPTRPKLHPLLGPRPSLDWVDHLTKAVQTALQKVPK